MIKFETQTEPKIDIERTKKILDEIAADPMGGWLKLPETYDKDEFRRIKNSATKVHHNSKFLVCAGIGGSYLGHRAIIEALSPMSKTEILYTGNSLSFRERSKIFDMLDVCRIKGRHSYGRYMFYPSDFSLNIISKSGTTLETTEAVEDLIVCLHDSYGGENYANRIYATTDAHKGALYEEAVRYNYHRFVVPDNIGGRYSVLTAVGLFPMAVAGINIDALLAGAKNQMKLLETENLADHPAIKYAWARYELAQKGYDTEVFATFEPATNYFNEWIKQLFGESEGKNGQGIFPASVVYTTDLHSMGQYMQDGRRNIFETIIDYPTDSYNAAAVDAVETAHRAGGLPVFRIKPEKYNTKSFGELIYFFELACAVYCKLIGVNPFDQPGVEAYKAELKRLLKY